MTDWIPKQRAEKRFYMPTSSWVSPAIHTSQISSFLQFSWVKYWDNRIEYMFAYRCLVFAIVSKVPTKINDVTVATGNDRVDFRCVAFTDSSTPLTLLWRKYDAGLDTHDPRVNLTEDNTLLSLDLHDLSPEEIEKNYTGVYKCIASNGYSSQEKKANFAVQIADKGMVSHHLGTGTKNRLPAVSCTKGQLSRKCHNVIMKFPYHDIIISVVARGAGDIWWIFVVIVVIFLLLILARFGVMCRQRSTETSYYGEYIMNLVTIGSGNNLSPFGVKPLPEFNAALLLIEHNIVKIE